MWRIDVPFPLSIRDLGAIPSKAAPGFSGFCALAGSGAYVRQQFNSSCLVRVPRVAIGNTASLIGINFGIDPGVGAVRLPTWLNWLGKLAGLDQAIAVLAGKLNAPLAQISIEQKFHCLISPRRNEPRCVEMKPKKKDDGIAYFVVFSCVCGLGQRFCSVSLV
jgi:hypothetical protein